MRHIPALAVLAIALVYAGQSHALVKLSAGLGNWQQEPSGEFRADQDSDSADVKDDLNIGDERDYVIWASFEHFVPLIPNLKVQHTPITLDGDGSVNQTFRFGNVEFQTDRDVESRLELTQTDFMLYLSPLNNIVELDLGLNVKLMDGFAEVEDKMTGDRESVSFKGPVPMLYANVQFNLPMSGFYVGAEGSGIGYAGHSLVDLNARVGYRFDLGLGGVAVEGGYRSQRLELDDFDGVDADLRIEGPWIGVAADF